MSGFEAFAQGALAGYGIAIPVGAIAVLIIELGVRRGFPPAFWAGVGAATADGVYATVAALLGVAVAAFLKPVERTISLASGVVLIVIAIRGVTRRPTEEADVASVGGRRNYATFLGLTLLNPTTVVYFTALIIGLQSESLGTREAKSAFVVGAFLASLSWQTLLAGLAGLAHRRLPPAVMRAATWTGSLIVAALGLRLLIS